MAKYLKPHRNRIKNPPEVKIEVMASFRSYDENTHYDGSFNEFRIEFIPNDSDEEFSERYKKRHYVEMSREETSKLVEELTKRLNYLDPTRDRRFKND